LSDKELAQIILAARKIGGHTAALLNSWH
jgi:hypothetical protein